MMTLWFYLWEKNGIDNIPWWFQMWQPWEVRNILYSCITFDMIMAQYLFAIGMAEMLK